MINAEEMRQLADDARRAKEKAIRVEASRWLRVYEDEMKAKCEDGEYILPRHKLEEVNESLRITLINLGYEVEYNNEGIAIKW